MKWLLGFLLTIFPLLSFSQESCGLRGSIKQRIHDCGKTGVGSFILVTKTSQGSEVYLDWKSGLLWGDKVKMPFRTSYREAASTACQNLWDEVGEMDLLHWRLPSRREFDEAHKNGIKESLPNIDWTYATSDTAIRGGTTYYWSYVGKSGFTDLFMSIDSYGLTVRCVAVSPR